MGLEGRLLIAILLLLGVVYFVPGILAATQISIADNFVLVPENPAFDYQETMFNDSLYIHEHDFSSNSPNTTFWLTIPKNTTITSNTSLNLTGNIVPIYSVEANGGNGILGLSIGDVTSEPGNEIVTGTNAFNGTVRLLYGTNGTLIRGGKLFGFSRVLSSAIGNVTSFDGNEIALGVGDFNTHVLEWDETLDPDDFAIIPWDYSTGDDVESVTIGDLDQDGVNEVVAGSDKIYVLNYNETLKWEASIGTNVKSVFVGDVASDAGNEVVVGSSAGLFVYNASGSQLWNTSFGSTINSVSVGEISSAHAGNEIVAGAANGLIYLAESDGTQIWSFPTGGLVNSVSIGDVVDSASGNEIVAGSDDGRIYTIASTGSLVWDFATTQPVKTVAIGNLTVDNGDEVAAGSINGLLFAFNFDYFPEDVRIDVGGDGSNEWSSTINKLRTSELVNNGEITTAIQSYLATCTEDAIGNCEVPIMFKSSSPGRLVVSDFSIEYEYYPSDAIAYQVVSGWSRTSDIFANDSVGNQLKDFTITNPANDVDVRYISIDPTATMCDFNLVRETVADIGGYHTCNVPDFVIPASGATPSPVVLWDNTMTSEIAVMILAHPSYTTTGLDNYYWRQPLEIVNTTDTIFTNVGGEYTLDQSNFNGGSFLSVDWNGVNCTITPATVDSGCDTGSPSYTTMSCNDVDLSVCKKDTNGDGVVDYFKWIQPYANGSISYETGGETNAKPILSNQSVLPDPELWGSMFVFTVDVIEPENDHTNVTLWLYNNDTDYWGKINTYPLHAPPGTPNGTATFSQVLGRTWSGQNYYMFEYQDLDDPSITPIHSPLNTSIYLGPRVLKHDVEILHIQGDGDVVNKSETVPLIVYLNDTNSPATPTSDVTCTYWVTTDGASYDVSYQTVSNSSGYCSLDFVPDAQFDVGPQNWIVGLESNQYYTETNSSDFSIIIKDLINVTLSATPDFHRNTANTLIAEFRDQYNNIVDIDDFNCTFSYEGIFQDYVTSVNGVCTASYSAGCDILGSVALDIDTNGTSQYYTLYKSTDSGTTTMKDYLTVTVDNPSDYSLLHKNDTVELNSTVVDTCGSPSDPFTVTWSSELNKKLIIDVTELDGLVRTNEPFIVTGLQLYEAGVDTSEWLIENTHVTYSGIDIPVTIKSWTDDTRTALNSGQVYVDNYTEIVFLLNLAPLELNKQYEIYYHKENQTDDDFSYIQNSGFESGDLGYWECSDINCPNAQCSCTVITEGTEIDGTHSIYLSANDYLGVSNSYKTVSQNIPTSGTEYIKIRYKAWGTFGDGSEIILNAGAGSCDLTPTGIITQGAAVWIETLCNNTDFMTADTVDITINDVGNGGSPITESHVYVDYICLADSNGNCRYYQTGGSLTTSLMFTETVGSGTDAVWTVPINYIPGETDLYATASGSLYETNVDSSSLLIFGWSNLSDIDIESTQCAVGPPQTRCMISATLDVLCTVSDETSGDPVELYTVDFEADSAPLGSALTDSNGIARWRWVNSSAVLGLHTIDCYISDQPALFYNTTVNDQQSTFINTTTGSTTGEVMIAPEVYTAIGLTRLHNDTFDLFVNLNNTGDSIMFNPVVTINTPTGVSSTSVSCNPLEIGQNCSSFSIVNVTALANSGSDIINVTAVWGNGDGTWGVAYKELFLTIESNPVLDVIQSNITGGAPISSSKVIGSFIVEAFGNEDLNTIDFSLTGYNTSQIASWITFEPLDPIPTLPKLSSFVVNVRATIPDNATQNYYYAYINASSVGTPCPGTNCQDLIFLNLSATTKDWEAEPLNMSKTIGLGSEDDVLDTLLLRNNRNQVFTFNLSTSGGNGSALINPSLSETSTGNLTSRNIDIYHNASSASIGTYVTDLIIVNNEDAIPINITIPIDITIINLKVDLITPTDSSPITNVNNGTEIMMEVNATFNEVPITQNMTWSAQISGVNCPINWFSYNANTTTWNISCDAPYIPENPINNPLKIIGNYTLITNMMISDQNDDAVIYVDYTPPKFSKVDADSVHLYDFVPNIGIEVDITDNTMVDEAWVIIQNTNGTNTTITTYGKIGDTFTFNYPNPNEEGEYIIYVFANDTNGFENSTTGWFDVYIPVQMIGNSTNAKNVNQTMNVSFFKPGTPDLIHTYTTYLSQSDYNFTIRRRPYDLVVDYNNTIILFRSFDPVASITTQHNDSSAKNLTEGYRLDILTLLDIEDIGNVILPADAPDAAKNLLFVYGIETPYLSYSSGFMTLNYTESLSQIGVTIPESYLRVYRCGSWNLQSRTCSATFDILDYVDDSNIDLAGNAITFDISSTSGYAVAEWCQGIICGGSPPVDPPPPITPGGNGDSGSSNPPPPEQSECGNGICEVGENDLNCPSDCESEFPFTVQSTLGDARLQLGENKTYLMTITNNLPTDLTVTTGVSGEIEQFVTIENTTLRLLDSDIVTTDIYAAIPNNAQTGVYTGTITVSAAGKTQELPVTIRISEEGDESLSMLVDLITPSIVNGGDLKFSVDLENVGFSEKFNVTLIYFIKRGDNEEIVAVQNETLELTDAESFIRSITLPDGNLELGNYFLEVFAEFGQRSVKKIEPFDIVEEFWASDIGQIIIYTVIIVALAVGGYVGRKRYKKWKKAKARYVFPVNYDKLPRHTADSFWIGRVAETNKKAWFNPNDLTTHMIVAGSTGAGKSVSASVFIEEALEKKIPVIVFDPTAQWTGFVKSLKDANLLKYYPRFGMDKLHIRPYKGMIFEVKDPKEKIDIKKYMIPGEITVFTLNKLKPGEYDEAVKNIIDSIFQVGWEESTKLKMLIIFDEVHRLLEKYGGKGGYISLEKACREFRKWGIGLIMCSQVLADFKEAVAGNVLTDVQLNTKSLTDIKKSEEKYGAEYARKISRQSVGVGMLQNPKYNDGKPYFVNFRPTWHNPHKITEADMKSYKEFALRLEEVERKIAEMEKAGKDVFDINLELKLAKDKLKLGNFRMAKIYITSLEEHLNIHRKSE